MLKIRQSYHGTGGKDGYRFEVYDNVDCYLGDLKDFPIDVDYSDVVQIGEELYILLDSYDSDIPWENRFEVVYHLLEPYEFKPKFDLGNIL